MYQSFFATLKKELVHHERFRTRAAARQAVFEYIEVFYNRQRRHSSIGNLAPAEYEKQFECTAPAIVRDNSAQTAFGKAIRKPLNQLST